MEGEAAREVAKDRNCPVCKREGNPVSATTVVHLVDPEIRPTVKRAVYTLCTTDTCEVVYYAFDPVAVYTVDQIRVPVWFKEDADPSYACYCSRVEDKEVVDAVLNQGARNIGDVVRITGAMKNCSCEKENPSGKCCAARIEEIIEETREGS